ncbi:pyridoxal phosphate-dependent aminotransferase [Telmatospirillum sp. J64-1]|uniref:pyridoxal phosphate-dependent aminotransferase n=1 Tax=Telmatospirillum sp. J64-1 TaxID=2502183 RepID=UPI00115F6F5D|nr:aminotransferase class I/II-fold pyridoxal phosphate-dependent enzyme [Telmatospirillum sp. J64-1]
MTLKVAKRGNVPPFIVMDVMRAAAEREAATGDVLHLEVGQPSTGAPARVVEAAKRALESGDSLGYTLALGIEPLREKIAAHYKAEYGVAVDPRQVAVTTGSSGAFLLAFLAAFEPGDRVAIASPGYPAYRNILRALGVEPVPLRVGAETRFQITAQVIEALDQPIDGVIVASPSNPTGTMLSEQEVADLAACCKRKGIRLISDEIYHGITFGRKAATAAAFADHAVVINSFSKYFSMTGWRLGWMVVPDDLARAVECLAQNMFISAPTLSQQAALAVFDCKEELEANVVRYARNRELLLNELPKAGFDRLAPADGAFYIYADISQMTNDAQDFCRRMLAETGIAATPGVDFDPEEGHRAMRFSFAGSTETMAEAVKRLRAWRK